MPLQVPVALLVFNRPDTTERVFSAIAQAQPERLLVVADGARPDRPGEVAKCAQTRRLLERVDWPCTVETLFSEVNLGCRARISSGLDWVFARAERAIILEDDCLPDLTFFRFCEELLGRYESEERVMMISGINLAQRWKADEQSYHFSSYGGIWGWASWRRAWKHYDVGMKQWASTEARRRVQEVMADADAFDFMAKRYQETFEGKIDTWDYQWSFARIFNGGLTVAPCKNLVTNLGFREDATHTKSPNAPGANRPTEAMNFPLQHPPMLAVDRDYDRVFIEIVRPPRRKKGLRRLWGKLFG